MNILPPSPRLRRVLLVLLLFFLRSALGFLLHNLVIKKLVYVARNGPQVFAQMRATSCELTHPVAPVGPSYRSAPGGRTGSGSERT